MRASWWLRTASVLSLVYGGLHTCLLVLAKPTGPAQAATVETMKATGFDAIRWSRSYWDFFFGYGLLIGIAIFVQAVVFWHLARSPQSQPPVSRSLLGILCAGYLAAAAVSAVYLFFAPAVFGLLVAACLAGALVQSPEAAV